jgi:lysophospholipase L1-like esterase
VFYGDSITDSWAGKFSAVFFPDKGYIGRGISGQTTPQMLVRFAQDVVHLKPAVVVILAGTNDIAGNTGPSSPEMIEDNFMSMLAIARANNIQMVISSILPADHYSWQPGAQPAEKIRDMNARLKALCEREKLVYLDYYTPMANAKGGLDPELALDGVHPTAKAYAMMEPLAEKAVAQALAK